MIRTYKYRLYPSEKQQETLNEVFRLSCWVDNHALADRRKRWQELRYSVTYNEQSGMWKAWRNEDPENNPLRLVNKSCAG